MKQLLSQYSLEEFIESIEAKYALRYTIILFVESVADLATLILEADYGIAPDSYRDAMLLLGEKRILPYSLAEALARLASLRNIIIHRY